MMKINSVIITFNPNENVLRLIDDLKLQGVTPIIVDNSSKDFDFKEIETDSDCYFLKLSDNLGIAEAQNRGIEKAIELGAEKILFFDQDSIITNNFVEEMISDYKLLSSQNNKIGALGPRFIDQRGNFYYKMISISDKGLRFKFDVSNINAPFHSKLLISSGSLIDVETIRTVGLMRADYFIDYVDTEWCIRAEEKGFKNYVSARAIMYHTIGDDINKNKFFTMPIHSPFRRYYIIRNTIYMFNEPHVPNLFVIQQLVVNLIHQFMLILSIKGRRMDYVSAMKKGLLDGLKQCFK